MNACMSEFRIVNPTLRTFSAAEARIAHSSIRFNNLSAAELGYPEHIRLLISSDGCTLDIQACDPKDTTNSAPPRTRTPTLSAEDMLRAYDLSESGALLPVMAPAWSRQPFASVPPSEVIETQYVQVS